MKQLLTMALLILFFNAGAQSFIKTVSDTGTNMLITETLKTDDGGFVFTGRFSTAPPDYHVGMLKTDAAGNRQWIKYYNLYGTVTCAEKHSQGGYYLVSSLLTTSSYTIYLTKTDSTGNVQWSKQYPFSGFFNRFPIDIVVGANDDVFMGINNITNTFAQSQAAIMKLDSAGTVMWWKNFGTGYLWDDGIVQLKLRPDSFIYIMGYRAYAGGSSSKACLTKITTDGVHVYTKYFVDGNYDLDFDTVGNILLTTTLQSITLPRTRIAMASLTDSDSVLHFTSYYTNAMYINAGWMILDSNGSRVVTGTAVDTTALSSIYRRVIRFKTDTAGNVLYAKAYRDTSLNQASFHPSTLNENNIAEVTPFMRQVSTTVQQLGILMDDNTIQLCYDDITLDTVTEQVQMFTATMDTSIETVSSQPNAVVVTTGSFSTGQQHLCSLLSIPEVESEISPAYVIPNPTSGTFVLHTAPVIAGATVCIYDILGKQVLLTKIVGLITAINMQDFPKGIYFFTISSERGRQTGKFVLE